MGCIYILPPALLRSQVNQQYPAADYAHNIDSAIIVHKRRKILSIVEEVEAVIATGHMCNQLAMQCVVGRGSHTVLGHNLLRAQTVVVILELDRRTVLAHLAQLSASAPSVAPDTHHSTDCR